MTPVQAHEYLEDFQRIMTQHREAYSKNLIEANGQAILALEKQIPKKPRETRCALMCANCGHKITEKGCKKLNRLYCKKCGQAILWESDTECQNN